MREITEIEIESTGFIKMLLYGQSGSGKTTFACTFPNSILIDLEKGKGRNKPKLLTYLDNFNELETYIDKLTTEEYYNQYDTVIFDSINEMIEMDVRDVVLSHAAKRQYDDQLTQGDYGKINRDILRIIRYAIDNLSHLYNLIFICAENPNTYQDEQKQPSLTGKVLGPTIPRLMDIVGCMFMQKDQHYLSISPSSFALAKNRYRINGNKGIMIPSYDNLINLITEEYIQ